MENIELKKHSSLIAINNKNLSVSQRKLYNSILYLSAKQLQKDNDKSIFKIKFSDIMKFSGYEDTNNRKYFKSALQTLSETAIQTNILNKDNINEWSTFTLLSQASIKDYDEYVTVVFPPIILHNIIFPSIYALLNLSIVNQLNSRYALPLYELLVDFKNMKKVVLTIPKLREILGVPDDKYLVFSWFKKGVIVPAVDEVNKKTDIEVEFELDKDDGIYKTITFSVKNKYDSMSPIESSAFHLLKSRGLPTKSAERFAKQLSKQSILEAIDILERAVKKGSVKNSTAYLTRILKNVEVDEDVTPSETVEKIPPSELIPPSIPKKALQNTTLFKEYIKNRINELVDSLTTFEYNKFIQEQNSFTIEHFVDKGIIDQNKNIVNFAQLRENFVFKGWIEKKYLDEELEYKTFINNYGEYND